MTEIRALTELELEEIQRVVIGEEPEEYQRVIAENPEWYLLQELSSFRANIVDWIPISSQDKVLEIAAGTGAVTWKLLEKAKSVIALTSSRKEASILAKRCRNQENLHIRTGLFDPLEKTFDRDFQCIVVLGGCESLGSMQSKSQMLGRLMMHLAEGGILVVHEDASFASELDASGLTYACYHPKPDSVYMTELIEHTYRLERMHPVVEEDLAPCLYIVGEKPALCYVKYSSDRSERYAISTEIIKEESGYFVRKRPLLPKAIGHLKKLVRYHQLLAGRYQDPDGLHIVPARMDGTDVLFPYIFGKTLEECMDECLKNRNLDCFLDYYDKYVTMIRYRKEEGDADAVSDLDLVFSNILLSSEDGKWYVIDCEWTKESYIPEEEIAFRALYNYSLGDSIRGVVDYQALYRELGLSYERINQLTRQEASFQKEVTQGRKAMSELLEAANRRSAERNHEETMRQEKLPEPATEEGIRKIPHLLKTSVQSLLYKRCLASYQKELLQKSDAYAWWIKTVEVNQVKQQHSRRSRYTVEVIRYTNCIDKVEFYRSPADLLLFVSAEGRLAEHARGVVADYFASHPDCMILYADEDQYDSSTKRRINPWFKPDWSPDTLMSFFYFGSIFAIRRSMLTEPIWFDSQDPLVNIYDMVLKLTEAVSAQSFEKGLSPELSLCHMGRILFHGTCKIPPEHGLCGAFGFEKKYAGIKKAAGKRRGTEVSLVKGRRYTSHVLYQPLGQPLISIIIPSKDNPGILRTCITSLRLKTEYTNYEIIVVDNGSRRANQLILEAMAIELQFRYEYEAMEFNFSAMCNKGAALAKGEYYLFLNDDMEIMQGSWLAVMLGQAAQEHTGAVGARLLYPGTRRIQHIGVVNLSDRPVHMLTGCSDDTDYYFKNNTLVYNCLAVTAACLMVSAHKFAKVDGFDIAFRVAYNDVDLCFKLYEAGCVNVQRNDVMLLHHESYSRGDDAKEAGKRARLDQERYLLYSRHPGLYGYDPYHSRHLKDGADAYTCAYYADYSICNRMDIVAIPEFAVRNEGMMITVEQAEKVMQSILPKQGATQPSIIGGEYYQMSGWMFVPNRDNARYDFKLLLEGETGTWEVPVVRIVREDVTALLSEHKNVELAGFVCKMKQGSLPDGKYRIWGIAKDGCSRQKIYRDSGVNLSIGLQAAENRDKNGS